MKLSTILPQFVEFIPRELDEGVLYISERYHTASHKCACGCGEKVVTPFSPVEWSLRKDGDIVSLYPSIGNWNYSCKSHYWIRRNKIKWAAPLSAHRIALVQQRDLADKAKYIAELNLKKGLKATQRGITEQGQRESMLNRLAERLRHLFSD